MLNFPLPRLVAAVSLFACLTTAQSSYTTSPSNSSTNSSSSSAPLPIIDLGYQLQEASDFNSTAGYYNFSNIRYAAPPTGDNRFRAPQSPEVNRSSVQPGGPNRVCPQSHVFWQGIATQFIPQYLLGVKNSFNQSDFTPVNVTAVLEQDSDSRATEDCLFLDVIVPDDIFERRGKGYGAPVLVWIYGGGYVNGAKSDSGNPVRLLQESESDGTPGVIFVALNYRLGAFGWLSGPTFQENGTANAGLHDQRFALEWVQTHIAKFGGDPNRVTVMGESAGGGSIMHQLTAYGGANGSTPFQQAILQSPAFPPLYSRFQQEQTFQQFLTLANATSLAELRALPYETLQQANVLSLLNAQYGTFVYGPTVDGDFSPGLPGSQLLHGHFDHDVRVMVGHNMDEGLLFTSPFLSNDTVLAKFLAEYLPGSASLQGLIPYILNTLYPPIFDGSQALSYRDQLGRASAIIAESTFVCNTFYLNDAYGNDTYAYLFSVPPALHGFDVPYTFYAGNGTDPTTDGTGVTVPAIAVALQKYLTAFAEYGTPNRDGVPKFVMYGPNATVQDLGASGISAIRDETANDRCNWWQKALYY